jgi:uncharacterized membrane protein
MPEISKEEIIMSSNDNSVTLTTHRVLYKTSTANKELLLKDMMAYEVIKKRANYYKVLLIVFGALTVLLYLLKISNSSEVSEEQKNTPLIISAILTGISLVLFLDRTEKFLKISGRFNEIEFSLKDLSEKSLNKFLNRLSIESDNRKREV